jgi:hypothetical protein
MLPPAPDQSGLLLESLTILPQGRALFKEEASCSKGECLGEKADFDR